MIISNISYVYFSSKVPNESFTRGFYGFRWVPSFCYIIFGFMATGVRLRKVSLVRNHHVSICMKSEWYSKNMYTNIYHHPIIRPQLISLQIYGEVSYCGIQYLVSRSLLHSSIWPPKSILFNQHLMACLALIRRMFGLSLSLCL